MENELIDQKQRDSLIRQKYLSRAPGDAATKSYIANKYLSTEEPKKKKKKKTHTSIGNVGIIDEDEFGWSSQFGDSSTNKKKKKKKQSDDTLTSEVPKGIWKPIGEIEKHHHHKNKEGKEEENDNDDDDDDEEENRPVIVNTSNYNQEEKDIPTTTTIKNKGPRMSSGQKAGLLTSKEIQQEEARARLLEQRAMERLAANNNQQGEQDTIYRDASGKRVDPHLIKAEEERKRKLEIEKQARKMEWGKGLVQRTEQDLLRKQLEEEKYKPLARYADDDDFNQGLKDEERWNDPAAGFLTKKPNKSRKGKISTRPTYKGPWKPNRFMIPPGYRWDGVDRSNGYEDQFLLQQNNRKSLAAEAHAWSTEDM
ncbi:unnamed protein product [Cunninghamella blakesleeana]